MRGSRNIVLLYSAATLTWFWLQLPRIVGNSSFASSICDEVLPVMKGNCPAVIYERPVLTLPHEQNGSIQKENERKKYGSR